MRESALAYENRLKGVISDGSRELRSEICIPGSYPDCTPAERGVFQGHDDVGG